MNAVIYRRVSTLKQGLEGLGMAAQDTLIQNYLKTTPDVTVVGEFEEVETGTNKRKRPMLHQALEQCKIYDATLIVATLSRLSRNVNFISGLIESKVKFMALDCPSMDKTMTYFLSVVGEWEADVISKRVTVALQAAKERGPVYCEKRKRMTFPLGAKGIDNLTEEYRLKGSAAGVKKLQANAKEFAKRLEPILRECQSKGMSLSDTAKHLTALQVRSARGGTVWYPGGVSNLFKTLEGK